MCWLVTLSEISYFVISSFNLSKILLSFFVCLSVLQQLEQEEAENTEDEKRLKRRELEKIKKPLLTFVRNGK